MDYIHIDNLTVSATHGYFPHEGEAPQRFMVSVRVGISKLDASDRLTDTINYDDIRHIVETVFAGDRVALIETLGNEALSRIRKDARVEEAQITIQKLDVWEQGVPGITLNR